MELFGMSIPTIYLVILGISGAAVLLYMLFGDVMEGIGEGIPIFNPTIILVFFIFLSAIGYILELVTSINSLLIVLLAVIGSIIVTTLLNIFVLVPISSAEGSLAYTNESLKGRIGKTIISIPADGFGEILIESNSGRIAKAASSFDKTEIPEGVDVLVIDVKDGVLLVRAYDENHLYQT